MSHNYHPNHFFMNPHLVVKKNLIPIHLLNQYYYILSHLDFKYLLLNRYLNFVSYMYLSPIFIN